MEFWESVAGRVRMELTAADPGGVLGRLTAAGITVTDVTAADDGVTLAFSVARGGTARVEALAKKHGWGCKRIGRAGLYWPLRRLLERPVLTAGILFFFAMALFLPSRVLTVRVEGNREVPTRLILERAAEHGLYFGAPRSRVRSQRLKDALLEEIPQLQWAGVNTNGSTAVITVRERTGETPQPQPGGVASMVAVRDAVVTSVTVTRGSALCRPGQAVQAGEVLISGYTDCGLAVRAERAEGEIYGDTARTLEALLPEKWTEKGPVTGETKKYALIIGKKRINLFQNSGISDTTCDKMYEQRQIFLPGGLPLPVYIVTEIWYDRECGERSLTAEEAEGILPDFGRRYVLGRTVAGVLRRADIAVTREEGCFRLVGNYACTEMIGQVRDEEIWNDD